jgi:hypothetical protein
MKYFLKNYWPHIIGVVFVTAILAGCASIFYVVYDANHNVKITYQQNVVLSEFITENDKNGQNTILKLKGIQKIDMLVANRKSAPSLFGSKDKPFLIMVNVVTDSGSSRRAMFESYDDAVIRKMTRSANDVSRWEIYTDDQVYSMAIKDAETIALRQLIQGLHVAMSPSSEEIAEMRKAEWAQEAKKYATGTTEIKQLSN